MWVRGAGSVAGGAPRLSLVRAGIRAAPQRTAVFERAGGEKNGYFVFTPFTLEDGCAPCVTFPPPACAVAHWRARLLCTADARSW